MAKTKPKPKSKRRDRVIPTSLRGSFEVESLRLGEAFDGPEMEEILALEALRRGGDAFDVFRLLTAHRDQRRRSRSAHALRGLGMEFAPLSARLEFDVPPDPAPYVETYRKEVLAEWERIPDWVRRSFDFDLRTQKNEYAGVADADRRFLFYLKYRPVFYRSGYSSPGDQVFRKLKQPKFLGLTVGGGVHEAFAEALERAEAALAARDASLPGRIGRQLKSVYGFVPRYIAGSDVLSNHAFGLAVDIDPWWNPHVKGTGNVSAKKLGPGNPVYKLLEEVTGHDFGADLSLSSFAANADRIREIHANQAEASEKLKRWLGRALPTYLGWKRDQPVTGKVTKKSLAKDPVMKEDEFTEGLPTQSFDRTASFPEDGKVDAEARKVEVLVEAYGLDTVKEWARQGIQTVPVELAVALTGAGMRWGSEYEHSKDVMHFELHPPRRYAPPDAGKRALSELFPRGSSPALRLGSEWLRAGKR